MARGLENRLRKLEKTVRAQEDDIDRGAWREAAEKLRRTPEARAVLRAYWSGRLRAERQEQRKRIEAVMAPERLVSLRQEWAREDAESEAREEKYLKEAKVAREDLLSVLRGMIG
jgi:hypothetical protein